MTKKELKKEYAQWVDENGLIPTSNECMEYFLFQRDKEYQDLLVWLAGQKLHYAGGRKLNRDTKIKIFGYNKALEVVEQHIKSKI